MKLFWVSGQPRSWAIQATLKLSKVDADQQIVDISSGDTKTPEYLAMMRGGRGRAPALRTEKDGIMVGVIAAARYISLHAAPDAPKLYPTSMADESLLLDVLDQVTRFDARFTDLGYWAMLYRKDQPFSYMDWAWKEIQIELSEFESICKLNGNGKLSSHGLSIADLWLCTLLIFFERFGGKLDTFPMLNALVRELEQTPALQETYPPHWKNNPPKVPGVLAGFYEMEQNNAK